MIAEIQYTLNGKRHREVYDFGWLENPPDAAGIEYRFHCRMQLRRNYQCFEDESGSYKETVYTKRYSPREYQLEKITLEDGTIIGASYNFRKVYDHFKDHKTPKVTRKSKRKAPEQPELNL